MLYLKHICRKKGLAFIIIVITRGKLKIYYNGLIISLYAPQTIICHNFFCDNFTVSKTSAQCVGAAEVSSTAKLQRV